MPVKTVLGEAQQIRIATELIEMDARLQLLQEETTLSRERLLKLYKEVKGKSPSKGMLPYSTDWYISWQPNIHSSLFMGIYQFLVKNAGVHGAQALITAYRLYLDQVQNLEGGEAVLSITRAWFLIRFFNAGMMEMVSCNECGGHFVTHTNELNANYQCGICHPPARAGKTRENAALRSGTHVGQADCASTSPA
ncbi:MAG: flagellar transcriptional regulator FlhC [Gallionella sp.]|nr:flagellar transcriptional regulator FlhC [Gallionella sp.]MDD4945780.1 flagellar transcriptional regulator FlhC [Gallionella sp.]